MKEVKWFLHTNHKKALDDYKLDVDGENDGWTLFCNSEEKMKQLDCNTCMSDLIEKVEKSIESGEKIDLSVLKDCYKVVFTVSVDHPINYLAREVLTNYNQRYGDLTEFHGKLGSSGHNGSRVLLFYESSPKEVTERKKQLVELVEDLNLIGRITETRACDYMLDHINLDKTLKSKVRMPETFLQRLKHVKGSYDQGIIE